MASMVDLVFDTSAVINGQMIKLAKSGAIKDSQVIILTAVMDELVSQASSKKESGTEGLRQIGLLREGEGKLCKKIIFQGRHPTAEEIKLAGKKLDDALKSAGLSRDEVYITNVVKCRPPKNRVPEEIERAACSRYLQDEIAALKPETVCVMGNTALQSVLGKYGITENRGKITIQDGVRYYPMVHPAATIYNRKLWPVLKKDIAMVAKITHAAALPRSFYNRDTVTVAKELLGKKIVRRIGKTVLSGIITETEAYKHLEDEASHAYAGRTERNKAMFEECGRAYVYFTYGMHYCFNIVARGKTSKAGAVLVRAIEPLDGVERMVKNRSIASGGKSTRHGIADGPAKIAQAMKITKSQYGEDLVKSDSMYVTKGAKVYKVRSSSRIGVSKGSAKMWNFTCSLRPLRAPKGQTVR